MSHTRPQLNSGKAISAALLLLFLVGISLRLVIVSPSWFHADEPYYLNIAQNFARHGELTPYMWRVNDTALIAGSGSGYGIILHAAYMQFVENNLLAGRLLMIGLNVLTCVVISWVAYRWWDAPLAGVAAFGFGMVATSSVWTLTIRMDAFGILAYSLVLLIYTYSRERRWVHSMIGLGLVAAAEFHILAVFYIGAFMLLYVAKYGHSVWKVRRILWDHPTLYYVFGGFIGGVLYVSIHILPNIETYFLIPQSCFECNEGILITEFKRLIRVLAMRPVETALLLLGVTAATARWQVRDQHIIWMIVGALLSQALFGPPPYTHYTNHLWLLGALVMGGYVVHGFGGGLARWRIQGALVVAIFFAAYNLLTFQISGPPFILAHKSNVTPSITYVWEQVPKETVILSNALNFFYFSNYPNYLSYQDGVQYGIELRGETVLDLWEREQPQVILVPPDTLIKDAVLRTYIERYMFRQIKPDLWLSDSLLESLSDDAL